MAWLAICRSGAVCTGYLRSSEFRGAEAVRDGLMPRRKLVAQVEALRATLRYIADPHPDVTEADIRKLARRTLEMWSEPPPADFMAPQGNE